MIPRRRRILAVRTDNAGDVLLAGPAVRALAADGDVTVLAGPNGAAAAHLLPWVDDVLVFDTPWIAADAAPVRPLAIERLVATVAAGCYDEAAIFTSSHQSALPMALVLRLAGVARIAAVSLDYPGSLLDHRIPGDPDVHEVERALLVAAALGHRLPAGDDGRLAVLPPGPPPVDLPDAYVVVHPGASVPARTLAPVVWAGVVGALQGAGHHVVLTGTTGDDADGVVRDALGPGDVDLVDGTDLTTLAGVIAGSEAVCTGNTGPMHIAAAVGTPVVVAFAPTVPALRWGPWRVPHVLLGDQTIACAGCRSRVCPLGGQPCLAGITPEHVVRAVAELARVGTGAGAGR